MGKLFAGVADADAGVADAVVVAVAVAVDFKHWTAFLLRLQSFGSYIRFCYFRMTVSRACDGALQRKT